MDLDTKVVGQLLQDVPLGTMIENLGVAIATAQERLDNVAIDATLRLANATTTMLDADGHEVTRSLLELGFTPTFYQFTEATLEVSFVASMQVAEALTVGFGFRLGGQIASADQAEQRLEDLEKQEQSLAGDMEKKKGQIEQERADILKSVKDQKEKFEAVLGKAKKKE